MTKEIHYFCPRRSLSKTKIESGNSVVVEKWLLFKDCTKLFMIIPLPEFAKCKQSFQSFLVCVCVCVCVWGGGVLRTYFTP